MMKLNKLKGNTYFIDAPTNIGVYAFKNKFCLLIDSGLDNSAARKIDALLKENNLHPKYIINTHAHTDHYGGNHYFKENYTGTIVYSSKKESIYMENSELFSSILFSSNPPKKLTNRKSFTTDEILDYGTSKINDEKFEILSLKGHSIEHIGIITPEKICFLGDSIFGYETLEKYPIPFLFNIKDSINTLNIIRSLDAEYFVISHEQNVFDSTEIKNLVDKNLERIETIKNTILELLDQPCTKEDILENMIILNDMSTNFKQHHLDYSSISAFISYLFDNNLIDYSLEDGKLYFFKK